MVIKINAKSCFLALKFIRANAYPDIESNRTDIIVTEPAKIVVFIKNRNKGMLFHALTYCAKVYLRAKSEGGYLKIS